VSLPPAPAAPSTTESESPTPPRWAGSVRSEFLLPLELYDITSLAPLKKGFLEMEWCGEKVNFPVTVGKAGYKAADPRWYEGPEVLLALASPQDGHNIWIQMTIDPDLLARGGEMRFHKSQIVSWFGTSLTGKPGFTLHGRLDGALQVEIVEFDGKKHIQGTIDANLGSGRTELEF
jgi:hypothetical protein